MSQSIKILEQGSDTITLQSADGDIQLKSSGGGNRYDNKKFAIGKFDEYDEKLQLKMKCLK